ncbi:VWA domain-containing protein [Candidatus Liberibacter asiaticus]
MFSLNLNIRNFFYNYKGGMTILTAIFLHIIFLVLGMIIEVSHIFFMKTVLHSMIDRSLVHAATQIMNEGNGNNRKKLKGGDILCRIKNTWNMSFRNELRDNGFVNDIDDIVRSTSLDIVVVPQNEGYSISAISRYKIPLKFCTFIPWYTNSRHIVMPITSSVKVNSQTDARLDMMIVLDVSRSMESFFDSSITKIDMAIKSINAMLEEVKLIPDVNNVVQSGLVTFSNKIEEFFLLEWGVSHLQRKIKYLSKFGVSTNSTPGLKYAYNQIFDMQGMRQHCNTEDANYKKIIVFMTDGENLSTKEDQQSLYYCNEAKKRGAIVYAIGIRVIRSHEFLRACASPNSFYLVENPHSMYDAFSHIGKDIVTKRIWYDK